MQQQLWVPILLNSQEINALFFALKALSLLSATPFEKSYHTIYKKLMATLSLSNQRQVAKLQRVVNYYSIPNLDAPKHFKPVSNQLGILGNSSRNGNGPTITIITIYVINVH